MTCVGSGQRTGQIVQDVLDREICILLSYDETNECYTVFSTHFQRVVTFAIFEKEIAEHKNWKVVSDVF